MPIGIQDYPLERYLLDSSRGATRDVQTHYYQGETEFAAPGIQTIIIDIDIDAPFMWLGLRGESFKPTFSFSGNFRPDATVMVRYGGPGGKAWSQAPLEWSTCVAYRPVPFMLPVEKWIEPGGQLHTTIELFSATVFPIGMRLQFFGAKVFKWRRRR